MATQKNSVNPLSYNVPIVNKDGTPTPEFMKKWGQQANTNANIPINISTAAQVSAILDLLGLDEGDILFRGPTEWAVLGPGTAGYILKSGGPAAAPAWESVSAALDTIGNTKGDILFNDGTNWNVLPVPASDGWVLTFDLTTGLPLWAAGGGGGGVTIGTGIPTALEPAGTPYSRDDGAGFYVSTPTTTTGTSIVQSFAQIGSNSTPGSFVLSSAPTPGNLVLLYLAWSEANQPPPTFNTTDWTMLDSLAGVGSGNYAAFFFYRYAQSGDTATLPALATAGGSYHAVTIYEIGGVSGTIGTDVQQHVLGLDNGVNPVTPTPLTSTAAGQLGLVFGGQYNGNTAQTITGTGISTDVNPANAGNFGSVSGAHALLSTSGASLAPTIDFHRTDQGTTHGMIIIDAGSAVSVAGWTLVGPAAPGTHWNLDKCGNVVVAVMSDGITESGSGSNVTWGMILADPPVVAATQKLYAEFYCGTTGNYTIPGLVPSSAALDNYPGLAAGWGVDSAGNPHNAGGGSTSGSFAGFTGGDTFAMAVDFGAGTIQCYKNNAAAGLFTGISFGGGNFNLAMGMNSTGNRFKLLTDGANQKYTAPSGFTPWG